MRTVFSLCLTLFAIASAQAAEIKIVRHPDPKMVPFIFVKGEFVQGDALEFERKIMGLTRGLVVLSSPGGSVTEGLGIGAAVRTSGLATMTADQCASACALVWLSGIRRYFNEGARIGFHAAYKIRDGKPVETGMANAEIGSFLTHLGLNREAIRFVASAPPNGMRWMTLEDAHRLNISVIVGRSMVDPSGKQNPPMYEAKPAKPDAEREDMYTLATGYVDFLEAHGCSKLFKVNVGLAQKGKEEFLGLATKKYGDRLMPVLQEVLSARLTNQRQEGERRSRAQNRVRFEKMGVRNLYLN